MYDMHVNPNELCKCGCHIKGVVMMHCMPCCDLTYEKYINTDGSLDEDALHKARNPKPPKRKALKG
jgi:hypothetical protein